MSLTGLEVSQGPIFEVSLSPPRWAHWLTGLAFPSRCLAAHHGAPEPSLSSLGLSEQSCFLPLNPWTAPTFKGCLQADFLSSWALSSPRIQGQRPVDTGQGCGGHRGPDGSSSGRGGSR